MIKFKKAFLLSMVAVMTIGVSVSADPITTLEGLKSSSIEVSGTTEIPKISVTVPTSAAFVVNPFGIDVSGENDQVVSTKFAIENASDIKVDVYLDGFTTVIEGSGTDKINLVSTAILPTATALTKDLFLYLDEASVPASTKPDIKKVVTKTNTTTPLNVKMGATMEPTTGKVELKFFGTANTKGAWDAGDKISVTPKFRFVPLMVTTP